MAFSFGALLCGNVATSAAARVVEASEPDDLFAFASTCSAVAALARREVARRAAAEPAWAELASGDGGRRLTSATSRADRLGRRRAWTQSTPCAFCVGPDGGARAPLGNGYLFTDEAWALGDENALRARVDLRFFPRGGGGVPAEEMIFGEERHRLLFHCGFSHNRKRWGERGADALTVALLDRNARGPCVWVRSRVFETQHGFKVQGRQSAWPVGAARAPATLEVRLARTLVEVGFGGVTSSFRLPPGAVPAGALHFGLITYAAGESDAVVTRVDVGEADAMPPLDALQIEPWRAHLGRTGSDPEARGLPPYVTRPVRSIPPTGRL